jgi:hypothetical protein
MRKERRMRKKKNNFLEEDKNKEGITNGKNHKRKG